MATTQKSCETEYARSWSFSTQLTMPPIPPGNQHSVDITTQILRAQILPARPDRVTHIEARYKSAESSGAVLSLEGYLQHSSGINRNQLNSWFRAEWTPVGGRLSVNADYKAYRASMCDLAYIHVQVHGEPKLGTGGTRSSATVCQLITLLHGCGIQRIPLVCADSLILSHLRCLFTLLCTVKFLLCIHLAM